MRNDESRSAAGRLITNPGDICAALTATGAISRETARSRSDFPLVDAQALDALIREGRVREVGANRVYVDQPYVLVPTPARNLRRFVITFLFWLVILLIPVAIIQFSK